MKKILLSMFLLGTLLSANAQLPNYVPSNGLVCWFPFNGNANDESGNGKNGVVNGATLTSDRFGNINSAYNFSGTTNDITLSNSQNLVNTSFSVSAWCTIDVLTPTEADAVVIGQFNGQNTGDRKWLFGYRAFSNQKGISYYLCDNSGNFPNNSFSTNWSPQTAEWYNITWVFNSGNSIKTYINGVLHSTLNTTLTSFNITSNNILTKIGNGLSANTPRNIPWNGKIDDVGIWNRVLTSSEITDLFNGCKLSISTEPTNQSSNINSQAKFTSLASDTTASYQWQSNASNMGWSNVPSSSFYSGVTTKKLTVNNIKLKNHEQLFRVIATKNTCKDTSVVAMLTVNDTCITSTTDTLYIKVNTSSLSNPVYNTVKVYPNPSSTQIIIDNGNFSTMGAYTAKIVNSIGQQVFQSVINQQQFVIDANTMGGAGVYTLYITDGNNKVVGVKKIVLQ